MVVKIAKPISGTDEGSGCFGGTVRLSIREGGGNDDKLGDCVMRVHNGRELNHYATREATELAAQNLAQKHRSRWYSPRLLLARVS